MKNIKSTFFTLLLFSFAICGTSQQLNFGPEIGFQTMPVLTSQGIEYYKNGLRAGLRVDYNAYKFINVSSGLFYKNANKTASATSTSSLAEESPILGIFLEQVGDLGALGNIDNQISYNRTMSLIELPILVNVNYKNLYLTVGPQFSFVTSGTEKEEIMRDIALKGILDSGIIGEDMTGGFDLSSFLPEEFESTTRDYKDQLNGLDMGFIIGLGYQMDEVHFNATYNRSFSDYRKNATGSSDVYSSFRFSVAYLINTQTFATSPTDF